MCGELYCVYFDCIDDCLLIQRDLAVLQVWCTGNSIQLNVWKCRVMSSLRRDSRIHFEYCVADTVVARSTLFRDLGVLFDSCLSFVLHIQSMCAQASRLMGFILRNNRGSRNIDCLLVLYNTYIRSRFEYCAVVWGPYHFVYIDTTVEQV